MNIIECAIDRETGVSNRFAALAAAAANQQQGEIFQLLAAAEQEHLQRLFALKAEMAKHATWEVEACPSKSLPQMQGLNAQEASGEDGYVGVVRAEEASIAFFEELAAKAENPEMRQLCSKLAEEERRHLQRIAHIYAFVEGPKTFLAWGEFGNLREF